MYGQKEKIQFSIKINTENGKYISTVRGGFCDSNAKFMVRLWVWWRMAMMEGHHHCVVLCTQHTHIYYYYVCVSECASMCVCVYCVQIQQGPVQMYFIDCSQSNERL